MGIRVTCGTKTLTGLHPIRSLLLNYVSAEGEIDPRGARCADREDHRPGAAGLRESPYCLEEGPGLDEYVQVLAIRGRGNVIGDADRAPFRVHSRNYAISDRIVLVLAKHASWGWGQLGLRIG